jgi:hypothetical protein
MPGKALEIPKMQKKFENAKEIPKMRRKLGNFIDMLSFYSLEIPKCHGKL